MDDLEEEGVGEDAYGSDEGEEEGEDSIQSFPRFEVRSSDPDELALIDENCRMCQKPVFREEFSTAFFCMQCRPKMYVCCDCEDLFLERHEESHMLGVYYASEDEFLENYKFEIMETCDALLMEEKYGECIEFCQKALQLPGLLQSSIDIALYAFRIGMICHVNRLEYTEAKSCGKTALRILLGVQKAEEEGSLEDGLSKTPMPFVRDHVEVVSKLCHIYLKLEKPEKCLQIGTQFLEKQDQFLLAARIVEMTLDTPPPASADAKTPESPVARRRLDSRERRDSMRRASKGESAALAIDGVESLDYDEDDIEEKLTEYVANRIDDVKYCCGKACCMLEKYEMAEGLLTECLEKRCRGGDFVKARFALSSLLEVFLLRGKRDQGLEKFDEVKRRFPDIARKQSDIDVSFIRMKKTVNKLRDVPEANYIDISTSIDGKVINFNKHAYLAVIDNDVVSSYGKLQYAIEVAEDLIVEFAKNQSIAKIAAVVQKRSQLVQRMYVCCLMMKKPLEAFQWAERGRSFLYFARMYEDERKRREEVDRSPGASPGGSRVRSHSPIPEDKMADFDNLQLLVDTLTSPSKMVDVAELIRTAKEHSAVFLYFVLIQNPHFGVTDFIDVWIVNPKQTRIAVGKEILRVRLTHRPLEVMKLILELFTEVDEVSKHFRASMTRAGFPPPSLTPGSTGTPTGEGQFSADDVRRWQKMVDSIFTQQVKKGMHAKYVKVLDELHSCLFLPCEPYLPEDKSASRLRKQSTGDLRKRDSRGNPIPVKKGKKKADKKAARKKRRSRRGKRGRGDADDGQPAKSASSGWVRPMQLIIVPDEFVSFIPFPFLKCRPNEYLIDRFAVSVTHSIGLFKFHLAQLSRGRKIRRARIEQAFGPEVCLPRGKAKKKKKPLPPSPGGTRPPSLHDLDPSTKKALFGLIITDRFDEIRKTELLPLRQLFETTMKSVPRIVRTSQTLLLSNAFKETIANSFNPAFHLTPPKVVHMANGATFTGKNLPTFQKELHPSCGVRLGNGQDYSIEAFERNVRLTSTELVVLSHHSSLSSNTTLSGFNALHGAIVRLGCPTIVYPIFDVSEFFTTLFLVQFFKYLFGTDVAFKKTKGEAFRHAMLSAMEIFPTLRKAPMFLSPFIMFGDVWNKFNFDMFSLTLILVIVAFIGDVCLATGDVGTVGEPGVMIRLYQDMLCGAPTGRSVFFRNHWCTDWYGSFYQCGFPVLGAPMTLGLCQDNCSSCFRIPALPDQCLAGFPWNASVSETPLKKPHRAFYTYLYRGNICAQKPDAAEVMHQTCSDTQVRSGNGPRTSIDRALSVLGDRRPPDARSSKMYCDDKQILQVAYFNLRDCLGKPIYVVPYPKKCLQAVQDVFQFSTCELLL